MSLALIRGNILTALANRNEHKEVRKILCEDLGTEIEKALQWLPEDMWAPHELIERSWQQAQPSGKALIENVVEELIQELTHKGTLSKVPEKRILVEARELQRIFKRAVPKK